MLLLLHIIIVFFFPPYYYITIPGTPIHRRRTRTHVRTCVTALAVETTFIDGCIFLRVKLLFVFVDHKLYTYIMSHSVREVPSSPMQFSPPTSPNNNTARYNLDSRDASSLISVEEEKGYEQNSVL